MEGALGVLDRINLALSKKVALRRARDLVHDLGNELQQWKNVDDQFDSIAEDLSERFRAVEARENATAERIKAVELQETELKSVQLTIEEFERNFRAKDERLKFLESRLDSCEREVVEKEKKLESCEMKCRNKEKELLSLSEAVEEHSLKIKDKEKELWSVQQRVEESELDFIREDEKLGFLLHTIDSCDQQISKKEENLGLLEVKLLLRDSEIKEKEKDLHLLHQTFVSKKKEMEAQFASDVASKMKELGSLQLKIDAHSKELSSLETSVADYSKRLDSKRIELDLITKKAAEFAGRESDQRQSQSQQQQLEERRQQTTVHVGFSAPQNDSYPTGSASSSNETEIKTEPPEFPTHQQYIAANNYLNPISGNLIVNDVSQKMIQAELEDLNIDIDLAKFTLDEIHGKSGQQLIREDKGFDAEAMKTHIKSLERITTFYIPITPQVKQGAMDFAAKWVRKLRTRNSIDPLEVLGFFNFLAAYKLGSLYSQTEISSYIQMYSLHDKAPQLCRNILHSGYVIPSPKDLMQQKSNKKRSSSSGLLGEQDLMSREDEVASARASLEERNQILAQKERKFEERLREFQLKEAEFASKEKERQSQLKVKIEKDHYSDPLSLDSLLKIPGSVISCDPYKLWSLVCAYLDFNDLVDKKVTKALECAKDPAELVLQAIISSNTESRFSFDIIKRSSILLLGELSQLHSEIIFTPDLKISALRVASQWKTKLNRGKTIDVLAFLQFLAIYEVAHGFYPDEIQGLLKLIPDDKQDALREALSLSGHQQGYVIPSPKDLMQQKSNKKRSSSSRLLGEQGTRKASPRS